MHEGNDAPLCSNKLLSVALRNCMGGSRTNTS